MITSAKKAIKLLIQNNSTGLVSGLISQGIERKLYHVTTSRGTPPRAYFYVSIHARPVRRQVRLSIANDPVEFYKTVYAMEITFVDYLVPETGENQLYEQATENADTFVDRLMALIESNPDLISGSSKFRLVDPLNIEADIAIVNYEEAEAYHHVYLADITFELELC